jgi:hypothetical protein
MNSIKKIGIAVVMLLAQGLAAQGFDYQTYLTLLETKQSDFITVAEKAGLKTEIDDNAKLIFAKIKGVVYLIPTDGKGGNEFYDFVFGFSTLDKANNAIVFQNAEEIQPSVWLSKDQQYMYREMDMENPYSKEMWYKIFVYKKKK